MTLFVIDGYRTINERPVLLNHAGVGFILAHHQLLAVVLDF